MKKETKISDFISSFSFDQRLAEYDILGSMAHVKMLSKCKIISSGDGVKIINGLKAILKGLNNDKKIPKQEDIHYAVEKELIRRIGPVGGKMHTARSRNDQVSLDLRLYIRDEIRQIYDLLADAQKSIISQAKKNHEAVMPGYTHLQPAQPILFSHHILAYAWMFQRDKERLKDCYKRVNVLPLGSASLAGTSFPIDRKYVAKLLGFRGVMNNSIDAVSDRDFVVEFVFALSLIASHLSRLCEDLIVWSSAEFGFISMADEFTSGSSIMPQKRNPDAAEIIRGKTGRVYGDLITLLTLMKGIPLSYNRDMQEDKPPLFDAVDSMKSVLEITAPLLLGITVNPEKMLEATKNGYICATEVADYLAKKNVPFRTAHKIVKDMVKYCIKKNIKLDELTGAELKKFSKNFNKDISSFLKPDKVVYMKSSEGGTSPKSVKKQIKDLSSLL
ncbi:MAG: argininosuccinate lyase [Endomicrobiales bacterium]|nr:argininosuccinate lyase [Endomicrobiales bacterium]